MLKISNASYACKVLYGATVFLHCRKAGATCCVDNVSAAAHVQVTQHLQRKEQLQLLQVQKLLQHGHCMLALQHSFALRPADRVNIAYKCA